MVPTAPENAMVESGKDLSRKKYWVFAKRKIGLEKVNLTQSKLSSNEEPVIIRLLPSTVPVVPVWRISKNILLGLAVVRLKYRSTPFT
jgi:hypothetical protein